MKENVYQTATLVTVLSVAERALGFLYRIVLSRLIGAEGLGLYQVALSVFAVFLTVGTGGVPVTVSRLISKSKAAKNLRAEQSALCAGLCAVLILTVPVYLIFYPFKRSFSFLFSDERQISVFSVLLIGLTFTSLYAVLKGSFWGNKKFLFASVVDIVEEAVMVIVGVLLLRNAKSPFDGALKAAVAVVISYLVSFLVSSIGFFSGKGKLSNPREQFKPLFSAAMPITAVRASGSLVSSAVAVILPATLISAGYSPTEALKLFGVVSGMVMPVLSVPSTLIGSISLVLTPELSEDFYKGNKTRLSKNIDRGIFTSAAVACALIPLFFVLGNDLGRLLFSNATAGKMIEKSCFILLPMSLAMITTGVLNSMNFEKRSLAYYFIGAAAMLVCIFFLPNKIGVYAYPLGLGVNFALVSFLNTAFIKSVCPISLSVLKKSALLFSMMLPVSLLGKLVYSGCLRLLGGVWAIVLCGAVMGLLELAVCLIFKLFSFKRIKNSFFKK